MDAIVATTELEAVNEMLRAISESPVETLSAGNADAQDAVTLLRKWTKSVQSLGWEFNTEVMTLTPDVSGFIALPSDCLKVSVLRGYDHRKLVERNRKLYSRYTNSYVHTASCKAEIVSGLPFTYLPEPAREYITALAGYEFCHTQLGAEPNLTFTQQRVGQAKNVMLQHEVQHTRPNSIYDSNHGSKIMVRSL